VLVRTAASPPGHPFHHEEANEEHQSHHDREEPPISRPEACTGEHRYHLLSDLIDENRERKDTGGISVAFQLRKAGSDRDRLDKTGFFTFVIPAPTGRDKLQQESIIAFKKPMDSGSSPE
jgi:hypothetical protein